MKNSELVNDQSINNNEDLDWGNEIDGNDVFLGTKQEENIKTKNELKDIKNNTKEDESEEREEEKSEEDESELPTQEEMITELEEAYETIEKLSSYKQRLQDTQSALYNEKRNIKLAQKKLDQAIKFAEDSGTIFDEEELAEFKKIFDKSNNDSYEEITESVVNDTEFSELDKMFNQLAPKIELYESMSDDSLTSKYIKSFEGKLKYFDSLDDDLEMHLEELRGKNDKEKLNYIKEHGRIYYENIIKPIVEANGLSNLLYQNNQKINKLTKENEELKNNLDNKVNKVQNKSIKSKAIINNNYQYEDDSEELDWG